MTWFRYGGDSAQRIGEPAAISGDDDGFLEDLKFALHSGDFEDRVYLRSYRECLLDRGARGPARLFVRHRRLYFGGRETYGPQTADVLRETLAHAIAAFARFARRDSARRDLVALCPQHIDLLDGGGSLLYLKSAAIDYHGYTVQDLNAQRSSHIRMIEPRKSAFGHGGIATGGTGSGSPC